LGNRIEVLELPRGKEATVGSGEDDTLRIARRDVTPSYLWLSVVMISMMFDSFAAIERADTRPTHSRV
jgi:hypothetical protein